MPAAMGSTICKMFLTIELSVKSFIGNFLGKARARGLRSLCHSVKSQDLLERACKCYAAPDELLACCHKILRHRGVVARPRRSNRREPEGCHRGARTRQPGRIRREVADKAVRNAARPGTRLEPRLHRARR